MTAYGVLSERQTEAVILAVCRTGSRSEEEIGAALKWADGIAIAAATLDLVVSGKIELDLGPGGEVLLHLAGAIEERCGRRGASAADA